jgi:hypothetical protein
MRRLKNPILEEIVSKVDSQLMESSQMQSVAFFWDHLISFQTKKFLKANEMYLTKGFFPMIY